MNYKKEIIIRGIKIIDIGYITTIYLILGILFAKMCDNFIGKFNEKTEKNKPIRRSILELILFLWFAAIVTYFVRNLIPLIPFPLNGIYGFDHLKVKELTSAATFSLAFFIFNQHYQEKVNYILSVIE
jgi:hypothetical protein